MVRSFVLIFSLFMIWRDAFSQEATALHEIEKGSLQNEYVVKTIISGLKGVDIARVTYKVDDTHIYKKVLRNELFSSRNNEHIKFYLMGVPDSGIVAVELSLTLKDNSDYSFPVEFQYARNDKNIIVQLPELVFTATELLAIVEVPIAELPANEVVPVVQKNIEEINKEIVKEDEHFAKESDEVDVLADKIAVEKAKEEAEAEVEKLAREKAEEEEKIAKAIAKEDERLAKEKAEADLLAAKVTEEEVKEEVMAKEEVVTQLPVIVKSGAVVEEDPIIKEELAYTKAKYTIQILSLSKFSKARFDAYCEKHSLLEEEVSTRVVNGVTKVIYGKANSIEEAKKMIDKLKLLNNIDGAFAVLL